MPSLMAGAPAAAIHAAPTSSATLNAFWNIVPPHDGIERDRRRSTATPQYAMEAAAGKRLSMVSGSTPITMARAILASRQAKRAGEIKEVNAATRGSARIA